MINIDEVTCTGAACDGQITWDGHAHAFASGSIPTSLNAYGRCLWCQSGSCEGGKLCGDNSDQAQTVCQCVGLVDAVCPSTHIFAYNSGADCCDTNLEDDTSSTGCTGATITRDTSTCCSGNTVSCTGTDCEDAGKITVKKMLVPDQPNRR